jgi:magnesium chelatase subunit D
VSQAVSPQLPFTAVLGQDEAKLALILAACDRTLGGVLLRGEKGSAKTTLARGLARLLPGDAPFVELPLGAGEDRVVGSLDLSSALAGGQVLFEPGLLAAADGGVLYVDEINLLADHLVDVLLDAAATGVNRVERDGVSHSHPSRFVLVGSMNPEEGELRPQLLDRFGLAVEVRGPADPARRADALRRRLDFDRDPAGVAARFEGEEADLARRLASARPAALPDRLVEAVAALCATAGAEGLRADLSICRAAAALAGWEGRAEATVDDARRVAPLALAHRARRDPFDPVGDGADLADALERHLPAGGDGGDGGEGGAGGGARDGGEGGAGGDGPAGPVVAEPGPAATLPTSLGTRPAPVATPPAAGTGRRRAGPGPRGRLIGDRAPDGPVTSLAVAATARRAAARHRSQPAGAAVEAADLRQSVHRHPEARLVVVAVDASGSMNAPRRMEAAKGVVLGLLRDAYQRRDLVALVSFRGEGAEVLLRPTSSVEVARARLAALESGGHTPLAAGLRVAHDVIRSRPGGGHRPFLVVITDGRATAPAGGPDPLDAAYREAERLRRAGTASLVVDVEGRRGRLGLAGRLAGVLGAETVALDDLDPEAVAEAVRIGPGR